MTDPSPLLALLGGTASDTRPIIEAGLETPWRIEEWKPGDDDARLADLIREATAVIPGGDALTAGGVLAALGDAPKLKLLQLPFTGYEWLDFSLLPKGIMVANAYGHEVAIAEFVMGALLQWEKDFCALESTFRAGSWKHRAMGRTEYLQGELANKSIGLVGYGAIAQEIAKRAGAFGMRVIAVSRSERDTPPDLEWYGTMERLHDLLDQSDYAALTCALNDDTRGLIDTPEFDAMGRETTLINVARAQVVEEDALYEALKQKTIRGAILDVWYKYPTGALTNPGTGGGMPSRYDFAALDNVLMTPHCSANTEGAMTRRCLGMATNLNLLAKGERPATYIGEGTKG
jgi:phosphoglycerate dehydrogenase-like enzyme